MPGMTDSEFMSAQEKRKVLHQWEVFLKGGLKREQFTRGLYNHLIQHCSFIAHYNLEGFYGVYFTSGEGIARFLHQFDTRNANKAGIPLSVEYGCTYWAKGDYADINMAMIEAATPYIPSLLRSAGEEQKASDVAEARRLLSKHGMTL
ncbi:MAG: hypothetical protein PHV74_13820 [Dehalococcoidia bacterium]|nr:hypothetical protein [Dehalococcoidia bacterium]